MARPSCPKQYTKCPKTCRAPGCKAACQLAPVCCTEGCVFPQASLGLIDETGRIKPSVVDEVQSHLATGSPLRTLAAKALVRALRHALEARHSEGSLESILHRIVEEQG